MHVNSKTNDTSKGIQYLLQQFKDIPQSCSQLESQRKKVHQKAVKDLYHLLYKVIKRKHDSSNNTQNRRKTNWIGRTIKQANERVYSKLRLRDYLYIKYRKKKIVTYPILQKKKILNQTVFCAMESSSTIDTGMDTEDLPYGLHIKKELIIDNEQLNEIKTEYQENEEFLPIITAVTGNAFQIEENTSEYAIKQEVDNNCEIGYNNHIKCEISEELEIHCDNDYLKSEINNDTILEDTFINHNDENVLNTCVGIKEEIEIEPYEYKPLIKEELQNSGDEYSMESYNSECIISDLHSTPELFISIKNNNEDNKTNVRPEVVKIHRVISKTDKNIVELNLLQDNKEIIVSEILENPNQLKVDVGELLKPLKSNGFHCTICLKKFKSQKTLDRHEAKHLNSTKINAEPAVKAIEKNISNKEITFPCKCGKTYKRLSTVTSCLRAHDSSGLDCDWCPLVFYKPIDLRRHMRIKHTNQTNKHRCEICHRGFSYRQTFDRHMKLHSLKNITAGDELDLKQATDKIIRKIVTCKECGIKFRGDEILKYHMELEHNTKRCKKNLVILKKHKNKPKSKHKNARITKNAVKIISKSRESLRIRGIAIEEKSNAKIEKSIEDKRTIENKEKSLKFTFTCRNCGLGYSTLKALTEHKETHNKAKVKFECGRCNDKFPSRGELSAHRRLHCRGGQYLPGQLSYVPIKSKRRTPSTPTISDPKNDPTSSSHTCDICLQSFTSQFLMLQHKASHPFVIFAKDDCTHKKIFFK